MKVVTTRKEHICSFERCCMGGVIKVRTVSVTTVYKEGNFRKTSHFHPECYTQSVLSNMGRKVKEKEEILARRLVRKSNRPQGRPRKYLDPMKARSLICLLTYHKKAGNIGRVGEIEMKLKELEVKKPFLE